MAHLSLEAKEAIIKQALEENGQSQAEIARRNHIGYSTLQRWLKATREEKPLKVKGNATVNQTNGAQKLTHLLATAHLDEIALGTYCREQGIYSHQLIEWKKELMSETENKKSKKQREELRTLQAENKRLKKDLRRKEKALAETSALLILKKKADLIWGDPEDDS